MAASSGPHCPFPVAKEPPEGLFPPQPSASLSAHVLSSLRGSHSASPLGVWTVRHARSCGSCPHGAYLHSKWRTLSKLVMS